MIIPNSQVKKNKLKIDSLKNLRYFQSRIKPTLVKDEIIEGLAREGARIVKEAYLTSTFTNRTYNLYNSYVSAVFYNGRLIKSSVNYAGPETTAPAVEYAETASGDPEMTNGREEANKFLAKLQFSKGRPGGIQLVIAAAMFYSGIVESHGYSVLKNVEFELDELRKKRFNASKYLSHISLDKITQSSIYREDGSGRMEIINK